MENLRWKIIVMNIGIKINSFLQTILLVLMLLFCNKPKSYDCSSIMFLVHTRIPRQWNLLQYLILQFQGTNNIYIYFRFIYKTKMLQIQNGWVWMNEDHWELQGNSGYNLEEIGFTSFHSSWCHHHLKTGINL